METPIGDGLLLAEFKRLAHEGAGTPKKTVQTRQFTQEARIPTDVTESY